MKKIKKIFQKVCLLGVLKDRADIFETDVGMCWNQICISVFRNKKKK